MSSFGTWSRRQDSDSSEAYLLALGHEENLGGDLDLTLGNLRGHLGRFVNGCGRAWRLLDRSGYGNGDGMGP